MEIANGFSELNDPIDQRARFVSQEKLKAKGDAEAQVLDDLTCSSEGSNPERVTLLDFEYVGDFSEKPGQVLILHEGIV